MNTHLLPSAFICMQDDSLTLPKCIDVEISEGAVHLRGRKIPLPIRGKGEFTIAYLDDVVRVFKSPSGSVSLQVKASWLAKRQKPSSNKER